MANYCNTIIRILKLDTENGKMEMLYNLLKRWLERDDRENGYVRDWLGNIVMASRLSKHKDDDYYNTGGSVLALENHIEDSGEITVIVESKWIPMLKMWRDLVKEYIPNAEILYTAEEEGCEIYDTNVSSIVGLYNILTCDDDNYYELSEAEAVEVLKDILGSSCDDIEKLRAMAIKREDINVFQWEYVDIDEEIRRCEG